MVITLYTPSHDGDGESATKDVSFEEFKCLIAPHPKGVDRDELLIEMGWSKWEVRTAVWFPIGYTKDELDALWEAAYAEFMEDEG